MLRELSDVLLDLCDRVSLAAPPGSGLRVERIDLALPLDVRVIFRDGAPVLLADVPRSRLAPQWATSMSRLQASIVIHDEESRS